ncbi:hypothetical protein [Paenarthrobacter sp. AMU7]|uniref:Uncharacterized protein n=1 Tax=Paenarthrobacter sp. AMU7 TaxID=3162492 RepID=A0AB39YNA7_9MICC
MDASGVAQLLDGGDVGSDANPPGGRSLGTFEFGRLLAAMQSLPVQWQVALWQVEVLGRAHEEAAPFTGVHAGLVPEVTSRAGDVLRQAYEREAAAHT